jgi:hypothetical protein
MKNDFLFYYQTPIKLMNTPKKQSKPTHLFSSGAEEADALIEEWAFENTFEFKV